MKFLCSSLLLTLFATVEVVEASSRMRRLAMPIKMKIHSLPHTKQQNMTTVKKELMDGEVPCDELTGLAGGEFYCNNIDLVGFIDGPAMGSSYYEAMDFQTWVNDIWGWTDPMSGKEIAIVGLWDGTSFVDISEPNNPVTLGFLPSTNLSGTENIWRDIKVVGNTAYIVAEADGHGFQVFDLTRLFTEETERLLDGEVPDPPEASEDEPAPETLPPANVRVFDHDSLYTEVGSAHNVIIAEEVNMVFAVGLDENATCTEETSLAMYDISEDPNNPTFVGCLEGAGYVHDGHCIRYNGPDEEFQGVAICVLFCEDEIHMLNLDTLEFFNNFTYPGFAYVHQGWFSADHSVLYANDELDEAFRTTTGDGISRSYIFDISSLTNPDPSMTVYDTDYFHPNIDHNMYVKDGHIYQASYTAGARVRRIVNDTHLEEVAYFDTENTCECVFLEEEEEEEGEDLGIIEDSEDAPETAVSKQGEDEEECTCDSFLGTWTYYPYYDSGLSTAGSTGEGLFILRANL